MSPLESMGSDVADALEHINVPSYVIDEAGVIRWLNTAARRLVGEVTGRQFTSVVAPEHTRRARELFARNLSGPSRSRTRRWSSSTTPALTSASR